MLENEVQLIRRTLSGDDSAFGILVRKYQKGVHALIWRKIGDFHHAEEITQDTFLQAYKKLGTLKNPNHFAGWLYVIANRLSLNWVQRQKSSMPSVEDTPIVEIEESSYIQYMSNQREADATEHRSDVIKKILAKLPESERTVVTLHYLGEMTVKEIGAFLGVSVNTIKSRLRRGRERLQQSESLVREMLGGVQLPANLTEHIMRQIADIHPTSPSTGKPFLPWAAFGVATVLVLMMLGGTYQYLARFQKPYNFEARSEPTIEIVDAPIVIDFISKPALQRQFRRSDATGKNIGAGTQISQATLRSNAQKDQLKFSTAHWRPSNAPPGGHVRDIFTASEGTVYAVSSTGMYRLPADANAWARINAEVPTGESLMPMVENQGVLYIVSADAVFASTDNGETWDTFCYRPKGYPVGLIVIDEAPEQGRHAEVTLYLALRDAGIFRSTDGGIQWQPLKNGLTAERISAIAAVGNTVFAGTNRGLYRLASDIWEKLPVETSKSVYSMTVLQENLYVATGIDLFGLSLTEGRSIMRTDTPSVGKIFRSTDLGVSWTEITPKDASRALTFLPSGIKVLAAGETLLALGATEFRSTDSGETWENLGPDAKSFMLSNFPSVALNERTFYKVGVFGIQRTTDAGESWHLFMDGLPGTRIKDLVVFNNRLYAHTGYEIFQSANGGRSWKSVPIHKHVTLASEKQNTSRIDPNFDSKLIVSDSTLYFLSPTKNGLRISRLSTDGTMLIPVQDVPTLDNEGLRPNFSATHQKVEAIHSTEDPENDCQPIRIPSLTDRFFKTGTAIVNKGVFYIEYNRQLLKWRLGDPEWTQTGFIDTGEQRHEDLRNGFRIAVSGETIYVGKRDGRLFRSLDGGRNWRNVTPNLRIRFTHYKEIVLSGSTVYIATDQGVLTSQTGEHWRVIRDSTHTRIVINQLAVDGTEVYGIGDAGVYRLQTRGQWEQFSSETPDEIISLAVTNGRLYSAVAEQGIFHIPLAKDE